MDLSHSRTPPPRQPLETVAVFHKNKAKRHETPLIKQIAIKHITKAQEAFPVRARHRRHHRQDKQVNITTRRFENQAQFDRAVQIYTQLQAIPNLTSLVPRLHGQDRKRLEIELQYPTCELLSIHDRVRGHGAGYDDRPVPLLGMIRGVRHLGDGLLNDIAILGDSQIACDVDLSSLRVVYQGVRFLPFLENFSLEIGTEDKDSTEWTDLKVTMVKNIKAQISVLQHLARLVAPSWYQLRVPEIDFDPEPVIEMLRLFEPSYYQRNSIICRVNRYIPDLGQYVTDYVWPYLYRLLSRPGFLSESQEEEKEKRNYYEVVQHVLELSRGNHHQEEESHLAVQASLWIAYTVLLDQLYAKDILDQVPRCVSPFDDPDVAEAHTSDENYRKVLEAHHETSKAVQSLYDAGGELERNLYWVFSGLRLPR
ncbi:hypothetical protein F5Y00DRAFT_259541 [Daldinia vernicosa]|uniref:uncharacterized protein n=1 Tax=Daldinia vernicosa TaxID=114800 RepID=UPI002008BED3|nr:uncharacterized protein F5Y00DRAFT_259541 [Daldinia vernicosa]KAI0851539.1 hypothetical protein F5Y00DRAFT_259541 [Daldinia vernicosa]